MSCLSFRLFLPYKLGQGDNKLQPDSVSRWLKSAARQALTRFIRGLVGVPPVEEILKAAYWNNETILTNFYLRDMSGFSEHIHCLGPFSVAQTTVMVTHF